MTTTQKLLLPIINREVDYIPGVPNSGRTDRYLARRLEGASIPEAIDGANRPTSEKGDDTNNRHEPPSGA